MATQRPLQGGIVYKFNLNVLNTPSVPAIHHHPKRLRRNRSKITTAQGTMRRSENNYDTHTGGFSLYPPPPRCRVPLSSQVIPLKFIRGCDLIALFCCSVIAESLPSRRPRKKQVAEITCLFFHNQFFFCLFYNLFYTNVFTFPASILFTNNSQ